MRSFSAHQNDWWEANLCGLFETRPDLAALIHQSKPLDQYQLLFINSTRMFCSHESCNIIEFFANIDIAVGHVSRSKRACACGRTVKSTQNMNIGMCVTVSLYHHKEKHCIQQECKKTFPSILLPTSTRPMSFPPTRDPHFQSLHVQRSHSSYADGAPHCSSPCIRPRIASVKILGPSIVMLKSLL